MFRIFDLAYNNTMDRINLITYFQRYSFENNLVVCYPGPLLPILLFVAKFFLQKGNNFWEQLLLVRP